MMLNTSISFLVVLCVFAPSSAQDFCYPDKESRSSTGNNGGKTNVTYLHTCGNKQYNISEGLCCNGTLFCGLSKLVADCCKSQAFNPLNEICCNDNILNLANISERHCGSEKNLTEKHVTSNNHRAGENGNENESSDCGCTKSKKDFTITPVLQCGSYPYDPLTHMCCSGHIYKLSAWHKCCGSKAYDISEKVICCNGILYDNLPENSRCVGGFLYMEKQTIMTCGSKVHNKTEECCGTLPVGKDQTCCSSSSHAMRYKNKLGHYCCGHQYYNKALWGCCAGDLTPTPKEATPVDNRLKTLTDLIPIMCNKTVVFGKVESVALQNLVNRTIWLRLVGLVSLHYCKSLHLVSLDHCSFPALEIGKTYLWETNGDEFKPISLPIGQASEMHVFFTVCNKLNETIWGV